MLLICMVYMCVYVCIVYVACMCLCIYRVLIKFEDIIQKYPDCLKM